MSKDCNTQIVLRNRSKNSNNKHIINLYFITDFCGDIFNGHTRVKNKVNVKMWGKRKPEEIYSSNLSGAQDRFYGRSIFSDKEERCLLWKTVIDRSSYLCDCGREGGAWRGAQGNPGGLCECTYTGVYIWNNSMNLRLLCLKNFTVDYLLA